MYILDILNLLISTLHVLENITLEMSYTALFKVLSILFWYTFAPLFFCKLVIHSHFLQLLQKKYQGSLCDEFHFWCMLLMDFEFHFLSYHAPCEILLKQLAVSYLLGIFTESIFFSVISFPNISLSARLKFSKYEGDHVFETHQCKVNAPVFETVKACFHIHRQLSVPLNIGITCIVFLFILNESLCILQQPKI